MVVEITAVMVQSKQHQRGGRGDNEITGKCNIGPGSGRLTKIGKGNTL